MIYGKLFYANEFIEAGIEVENGIVKKIGKLVKGKNVRGIILPAGIDVHVHFRDFKEKHKETIESGSLSALFGGICLVVDQPNTKPLVDCYDVYDERMRIAKKRSYVDYTLNLALTNENADRIDKEVRNIKQKYFLPAIGEVFIQHNDENLQISYNTLKKVREVLDLIITVHAEDPDYVSQGIPNFLYRRREAEVTAVKRCVEIGRFHFCHISTRDAAKIIINSNSTFEVTPHHLLLSVEEYNRLGNFINVNPPLRDKTDAEWLLKNFSRVDVLASDHAPHTIEEKEMGLPGFPGVEVMYPIFVNLAVKGIISFKDLVDKIAKNPAKIFGFKGYGEIKEGNYANLAVFDYKDVKRIKVDMLHSLCNWTPYEGFEAVFPKTVYIRGREALNDGSFERFGRVL